MLFVHSSIYGGGMEMRRWSPLKEEAGVVVSCATTSAGDAINAFPNAEVPGKFDPRLHAVVGLPLVAESL